MSRFLGDQDGILVVVLFFSCESRPSQAYTHKKATEHPYHLWMFCDLPLQNVSEFGRTLTVKACSQLPCYCPSATARRCLTLRHYRGLLHFNSFVLVQRYEENLRLPNIYRKKCCLNREYHSHRCRNINQQPDIADCARSYTLRQCKIFLFRPIIGSITISATVRNAARGLPTRSFSCPTSVKCPFQQNT